MGAAPVPTRREATEHLRRLLIGDLRRLYRHRYGPVLPDDDAGRDDLGILLNPISLAPVKAAEKMGHEIEVLAPWMAADEAKQLISDMIDLPLYWRKLTPTELGRRLGVGNAERERLMLWQIAPTDLSAEELAEQRKRKDRLRKRNRYKRTRAEYIAECRLKSKPWEAEGVSRATWYRRVRQGQSATRLNIPRTNLVSPPLASKMEP